MQPAPPTSETHHFRRQLGLFDATMLVAGTMIGSGIFLVSSFISARRRLPRLAAARLGLAGG
jgi:hypothetical protein